MHLGLYYSPALAAHSNRVSGLAKHWESPTFPWNAYEWEVTV